MYDQSQTIHAFLTAAAAKQPAPGGGSVTALAGALSASMAEMVLNYSVGKKNLAPHEPLLQSALKEFTRARTLLLSLMAEDQSAYEAMTALRKLPPDSSERKEKFDATLLACIRVPQAMAATAAAVLELSDALVDKVNRFLLSDLAVSGELAMATVRCALYNVRINLADLTDPADRRSIQKQSDALLARATPIIQRAIPAIWQRIDRGDVTPTT